MDRIADTDVRFQRNGAGDRALVFVHGFLDDQHVWDAVIGEIRSDGVETVQLDLAGMGERTDASGPFTLERFASEVGAVVDALDTPAALIGQSMAAPVVELVAAARPERTLGVVLVTPVPLAGTRLPDEAVEPFRSLGGDPQAQRTVRQQLSRGLGEADLDRLAVIGGRVRPEVVRALVDCWNAGHPDGDRPSRYTGPVLVIRGADDGFVTEDMVADGVLKRFGTVEAATVDGAGHWVHIERPAVVAALLDAFLAKTHPAGNTTRGVRPQRWTVAFAEKSAASFAEAFAEDVVLEANTLTRPVEGREQVKQVMETASGIYDSLVFTQESSSGPRTYLEWEATAFGGTQIRGVTILTEDERGQIVRAAIHHRPLGAALRFSAELRDRLRGRIDPAHFYDGDR
ncbi:alpha/beta hydrolase [Actinoallomurus purpureus]|uniref:alpha/beta fold hydrolase n=1 Tax=Actinoallomurus purpureus TaxID=478114 RepID=UPI0020925AE7|nr:alpha/beta hydrolase [Actinoallomurus purpureus]MCO6010993.1 alpha/beta hydrolase [Actinoallomurus purpureus]